MFIRAPSIKRELTAPQSMWVWPGLEVVGAVTTPKIKWGIFYTIKSVDEQTVTLGGVTLTHEVLMRCCRLSYALTLASVQGFTLHSSIRIQTNLQGHTQGGVRRVHSSGRKKRPTLNKMEPCIPLRRRPNRNPTESSSRNADTTARSIYMAETRSCCICSERYTRDSASSTRCRPCLNQVSKARYQRDVERERKSRSPKERGNGADLYIITSVGYPEDVKIGRSDCPRMRARQPHVVAIFPKCGHMERDIQRELKDFRTGRGREWFRMSLPDAIAAITTHLELVG